MSSVRSTSFELIWLVFFLLFLHSLDATVSTATLPAYDIRRSQEILDQVTKEIKEQESQFITKKKFSFSNKAKVASINNAAASSSSSSTAANTTTAGAATTGTGGASAVIDSSTTATSSTSQAPSSSDSTTPKDIKKTAPLPPGSYVISSKSQEEIYLQHKPNIAEDGNSISEEDHLQLFMKNNHQCTVTM